MKYSGMVFLKLPRCCLVFLPLVVLLALSGCSLTVTSSNGEAAELELANPSADTDGLQETPMNAEDAALSVCDTDLDANHINIYHVEVTQGIQGPWEENAIPIIADRKTAVLVSADIPAENHCVYAQLEMKVDGSQYCRPMDGECVLNSQMSEVESFSGTDEVFVFDSLTFPPSNSVMLSITIKHVVSDETLATDEMVLDTSIRTASPMLVLVPIDFRPFNNQDSSYHGIGTGILNAVLPSSSLETVLHKGGNISVDSGDCINQSFYCVDNDEILDISDDSYVIAQRLTDIRNSTAFETPSGWLLGPNELMYVYGMINDVESDGSLTGSVEANGQSFLAQATFGVRVAYGTSLPRIGRRILAHEFLHNLSKDKGQPITWSDHLDENAVEDYRGWDVDGTIPGIDLGDAALARPLTQRQDWYFPLMSVYPFADVSNTWINSTQRNTYIHAMEVLSQRSLVEFYDNIWGEGEFEQCPTELEEYPPNLGDQTICLSDDNYVITVINGEIVDIAQLARDIQVQPTFTYSTLDPERGESYREYSMQLDNGQTYQLPVDVSGEWMSWIFDAVDDDFEDDAVEGELTDNFFQILVPEVIFSAIDDIEGLVGFGEASENIRDLESEVESVLGVPVYIYN